MILVLISVDRGLICCAVLPQEVLQLQQAVASGSSDAQALKADLEAAQRKLSERESEYADLSAELKAAVKREAEKSVELSRAQQDLLLLQKAKDKLQSERDDLGKKVTFAAQHLKFGAVAALYMLDAK